MMKESALSILLFVITFLSSVAQQDGSKKPLSLAEINFSEKVYEFGDIQQGESVSKKFTFRNTGTEPLMILNVQTTCGCTATDWPKQPLAPGDSSLLTVTFNSANKAGRINKIVTVYTNGQKPEERLKITGNVLIPGAAIPPVSRPAVSDTTETD
jgi:hypothetical protein